MKKIAITGSSGVIGSALRVKLVGYEIYRADRDRVDLREYEKLADFFRGKDVVIHLAWNMKAVEGSVEFSENITITENVYRAALASGVKRVIIASSVHSDDFHNFKGPGKISPQSTPTPDGPYGVQKLFVEALGREYATKGLEVICVRLGDVNSENKPETENNFEQAVFLSHNDLLSLINIYLSDRVIPGNFVVFYAVSDNVTRIHDIVNPLGWMPKEKAENFLK